MLDFACEKNPNSVDTPDLTSRTMWCSGRQTSHNPGCGYLKLQSCIGTWLDGSGQRCKKNSRFFCGEVSVFHHGLTHFFATHGIGADTERARWVADAPCHWLQGYIRYIEQACSSPTEFCLVWIIPIPFYFFYLFLGLDVLSCHFSTTWSLNFDHLCQGFTCASHLDTILVSIVSIGRLSTAWCKLDCHTPVSRWGFWGDVARLDGEAASADYVIKTFQGWRASDVWSSFDHSKQVVSSCRVWG